MFRVAVCDDDILVCEDIRLLLNDILRQLQVEFSIETFSSGEAIYEEMKCGAQYDFIFLDINMRRMNGIELGHRIREELDNQVVYIIFISTGTEYAMELFDVQPFGFLVKPLNQIKVKKLIEVGIERICKDGKIFTYRSGLDICRVELRNILYFESANKEIYVIEKNGKRQLNSVSLRKLEEELGKYGFFRPHNSFLVNPYQIERWEQNAIYLKGGYSVSIASNRKTEVRKIRNKWGGQEW